MKQIIGLIGTYGSKGIYQFHFDCNQKKFIDQNLLLEVNESKYLSLMNDELVSVCKQDKAGILTYTKNSEYCFSHEDKVACYVTQDESYIYTANYHHGDVIRYHKYPSLQLSDVITTKEKAGAHQVILKSDALIVPCCLLDIINIYDRASLILKSRIEFPSGSGPRHGVLTSDEQNLYVISEHTCELYVLDMRNQPIIQKKLSLLSEGEHGIGAAIRLSDDERYVYVSVRDVDCLYVIDIKGWKIIQQLDCGGKHPRDMNLSLDGSFIFVTNRDSHTITAFERNKKEGTLTYVDRLDQIPEPVCIVFFEGGN